MVIPRYTVLLLLLRGGPDLSVRPLFLRIAYQTGMDSLIPEVHMPCDAGTDLSGPEDTQNFGENNMGKEDEYLGFTTWVFLKPSLRC